ncbi:hypothetical protein BSBH6_02193 [Bacillus subtilis]|nr:hypothetical protein BSBH6_02193 [Bacillus subtilis]RPK25085.1 hypothetical protein BH5_01916 [Bacillus subtilis]
MKAGTKRKKNQLNTLKTVDVINIPPHVKHWNGATKDS